MTAVLKPGPYTSPAPCLLAERARTATSKGTCAACGQPIRRGQRIAHAEPGWSHMRCVVQLPGQPR
jgi:hypothetical protein